MNTATSTFLDRHKFTLEWIHILVILAFCIFLPAVYLSERNSLNASPYTDFVFFFFLPLIGFCQNIGMMHHLTHHLPKGPRKMTLALGRLMCALGGLKYHHNLLSHQLHHSQLGTNQDPDRAGYLTTTSLAKRLIYLFMIGPIRGYFADVDISPFFEKMNPEKALELKQKIHQDFFVLLATHGLLFVLFGKIYFFIFAALICANILSNIREMTEHGNHGKPAYVNIRPTFPGVLFFSTPGFWYHGSHHMFESVHYWSLPEKRRSGELKEDGFPFFENRHSYLHYILTGE